MKLALICLFLLGLSMSCSSKNAAQKSTSGAAANWILDVKTVNRIAGGIHTGLAVDSEENAYLASFLLDHKTGMESGFVTAVSSGGIPNWEVKSTGANCRFTDVIVGPQDQVIFTGYAAGKVYLADFKIAEGSFIASLSSTGVLQWVLPSPFQGTSPVLTSAEEGFFLVGEGRVAFYGYDGDLIHSKYIGEMDISAVQKQGNFLVATGSVYGTKIIGDSVLKTSDNFDRDAVIVRFNFEDSRMQVTRLDSPGPLRNGYRTGDHVTLSDVPGQLIQLRSRIDETGSEYLEVLNVTDGNDQSLPAWKWRPQAMYGFAGAEKGVVMYGSAAGGSSTLIEFHDDMTSLVNIRTTLQTDNFTDAFFRQVLYKENAVWLAGSYRSHIGVADLSLDNEGAHSVFLIRLEIP